MLLGFLAFTSGYIDALALLGRGVFESFVSGNSILLGIGIGRGDILAVTGSAVALLAYIGGVCRFGRQYRECDFEPTRDMPTGSYEGLRRRVSIALGIRNWRIFRWNQLSRRKRSHCIRCCSDGHTERGGSRSRTQRHSYYVCHRHMTTFASNLAHRHRPTTSKSTVQETSRIRLEAWVLVVHILAAGVGGIAEIHWSLEAALIPAISIGLLVVIARLRMH